MKSIALTVPPLTVPQFVKRFGVNFHDEELYCEYRKYLEVNKNHHHYHPHAGIEPFFNAHQEAL